MLHQIVTFFLSAFWYSGLNWTYILIAIGLGLVFGAFWLASYWPPLLKKPGLWAIGAVSAFLTWASIAFIQVPLQTWAGQALMHFWSQSVLMYWIALAAFPQILLSGLVQEGAKLVPVVFYWWRNDWVFTPRMGLVVGALSGAGFGVFEAVWVHNTTFQAGWTWAVIQSSGLTGLLGFWERFFAVAFHIAVSSIAGYGLAKRMGWQFYLIASFLHALVNYGVVFAQAGWLNAIQLEIYIAVLAVIITAAALWLRWFRPEEDEDF